MEDLAGGRLCRAEEIALPPRVVPPRNHSNDVCVRKALHTWSLGVGSRRPRENEMQRLTLRTAARVAVIAAAGLGWGCGYAGAPSITVAGAYFPAWLACALIGITAALAARVVLSASGLVSLLPLPLLICSAVGAACAMLAWAAWIGL
jgi:hypothetical protein